MANIKQIKVGSTTYDIEARYVDAIDFAKLTGGYGRGLTASSKGALVIDSPADGVVYKASADATGILKILLPQDFNGAMIKFDVEICGYNRQTIATYSFGGQIYKNSSTGACQWANRSYDINGSSGNGSMNLDINFGRHNEKAAVSIGMSDTVWGYHVATIKNIVVYYSKYSTNLWTSGWQILIDSNPLSEIYNTYTNPLERKLSSLGAASVTIKRWEAND